MPSRVLPNLGLRADWDLGEDDWKDENDADMVKLSTFVQGHVISRIGALPGVPVQGDVYILTTDQTVQAYDEGAWVEYTPGEGWLLYDRTTNEYVSFDGAAWVVLETGGGGGGGGDSSDLYRFGSFFTTEPGADEVLMMHVATDAFNLPDELVGTVLSIGTNPTGDVDFDLQLNGASVGTVTVDNAGAVTLLTAGGAVAVDAGDLLTLIAPADSLGIADVAFTFRGDGVLTNAVDEAPVDGTPYARQDAGWVPAGAGGGGGPERIEAVYWRIRAGTPCPNGGQNSFLVKEAHFFDTDGVTALDLTGGTAIASGNGGSAINAFDGNGSNYWEDGGYRNDYGLNTWVGYQFAAPVAPFAFDYKVYYNSAGPGETHLDYSDDGVTWFTHSSHFTGNSWVGDTYKTFTVPERVRAVAA